MSISNQIYSSNIDVFGPIYKILFHIWSNSFIYKEIIRFIQLKEFEYMVFLGSWKFSRWMGFEPIRDNGGNVLDFGV